MKYIVFACLFFFSQTLFAQDSKESAASPSEQPTVKIIKLKITGLTCNGDMKDIQKQITELKGVEYCQPARKPSATTMFEVKFNPSLVSEKDIRNAAENTPGCSDPESRPYKVKS